MAICDHVGLGRAAASWALALALLAAPALGGAETVDGRARKESGPAVASPAELAALVKELRASQAFSASAAAPALIAQGKNAVRPLFDARRVKRGAEVVMLLYLFDHGALLEACLEIMADYRDDPEVRLDVGLFAEQFVSWKAIPDELKGLYKDLWKDSRSPDQVRVYAGKSLDLLNAGRRSDFYTASSVEYGFREPRAPSSRDISSYFLDMQSTVLMFSALGSPDSKLTSNITGFLLSIELLKITNRFVMPNVAPFLLKASVSPEPRVRAVAAAFLPFSEHPEAVKTVIALADDPEAVVRSEAARSLALMTDPAAEEKLRELDARRSSEAVASRGAAATQAPAETPGGAAGEPSTQAPGKEAITVILKRIASERNAVALEGQMRALASIGSGAVAPLVPYLSDSDEDVRVGAAIALGGLGDAGAVKPLVAVVTGENLGVAKGDVAAGGDRTRITAITALGKMRAKECLADLQRLFSPETEKWLLKPLAVAIAQIDEDAVDSMCTAAYDKNPNFSSAAVEGLSMLEERAARECVVGLLRDPLPANQEVGLTILANQVHRKAIDTGRLDEDLFEILTEGVSPEEPCNLIKASAILASLGWTKPFLDALERKDLTAIERHYPIFVMLASPGSEQLLVKTLGQSDSVDMYRFYKYSGNEVLMRAAGEWAQKSGRARAIEVTTGLKCVARWGKASVTSLPPSGWAR